MAEKKTFDALVDEEANTATNRDAGLTPEMIKDAVQRELASEAAKRILPKLKPPPGGMQVVKLEGF